MTESNRTQLPRYPAPYTGVLLTHLLIVSDQDRSRAFYNEVLGAEVVRERDPVVLRHASCN
jgi:lactoylglutathione lyase